MKKRWIALFLAAAMMGSFALTACDKTPAPDEETGNNQTVQGGGTQGGSGAQGGGTQGGSGTQGGGTQGGGTQGGGTQGAEPASAQELLDSLDDLTIEYCKAELTGEMKGSVNDEQMSGSGKAVAAYGGTDSDFYSFSETDRGDRTEYSYSCAFVRGSDLYSCDDRLEKELGPEQLLAELKDPDSDVCLRRRSGNDDFILDSGTPAWRNTYNFYTDNLPLEMRLLLNLVNYVKPSFTKVESGYRIAFDAVESAENILNTVINVVGVSDFEKTTLKALVGFSPVTEFLSTLLRGITAEQLRKFVVSYFALSGFSEEELGLPAAPAGGSAFDYLKLALDSAEFSKNVGDFDVPFGELPLSVLFGSHATKEDVLGFLTEMKEDFPKWFTAQVMRGDEVKSNALEAEVAVNFDKNCRFVSLDASCHFNAERNFSGSKETYDVVYNVSAEPCTTSPVCDLTGAKYATGEYEYVTGPQKASYECTFMAHEGQQEVSLTYHFDVTAQINEESALTLTIVCRELGNDPVTETFYSEGNEGYYYNDLRCPVTELTDDGTHTGTHSGKTYLFDREAGLALEFSYLDYIQVEQYGIDANGNYNQYLGHISLEKPVYGWVE